MLGIAEFACLKSGGFDLELTHITESEHLTEMIFFRTYAGKLRNPVSPRYLCVIAVEAKVRTLLNAEIHSEITSDFLLTRSAILRVLYILFFFNAPKSCS